MHKILTILKKINPILKFIIYKTTLRSKLKQYGATKTFSNYDIAKGYLEFLITVKRHSKDFVLILIGIFAAAFGFKGFLLTNHFIDGGATGISLLISAKTNISIHFLIILINLPFILMAFGIMGRVFAIKTSLAIIGLSVVLAFVDFPNITDDKLLVAVFGGFFLGSGIGFSIRGGAVIDGTEVLAIYLSKKFGTTIGDVIMLINIVIFGLGAYLLGIEIALYSMITYLSASKTLDFIVEGIEEYIGVTIVSTHFEEIREMVINKMGRGVTLYEGKRGYGKISNTISTQIIYTVVTRLELNKLKTEIERIDPNAFVVMNSVKDTKGGMIKRRPFKS